MNPTERLPTAERRRQIAEAALRIIATQGARRMTAAALAAQVGITDGTIFRHFKDKAEIVDAAIGLFEASLEATFPPPGGEPLERLGAFVVNRLTLVRSNPDILRLAFNDRLEEAAGEDGAGRVEQMIGRSLTFARDCLSEAQRAGLITRDTPVMLLVWMVIGVVRGAAAAESHRIPGTKGLATASPKKVWKLLEQFLCDTART